MSTSLVGDECIWAAVFRLDGWLVCGWSHAETRRSGILPFEEASSGFFLHVDPSAWGCTLVNSLLRVYGLLHIHWSKRVKRRKKMSPVIFLKKTWRVHGWSENCMEYEAVWCSTAHDSLEATLRCLTLRSLEGSGNTDSKLWECGFLSTETSQRELAERDVTARSFVLRNTRDRLRHK